jgi:hypothetical protein
MKKFLPFAAAAALVALTLAWATPNIGFSSSMQSFFSDHFTFTAKQVHVNTNNLATRAWVSASGFTNGTGYVPLNKAGDTMTGPLLTTALTNNALTASAAVVSGADKSLASSTTTTTELSYVHGVTSAIQTQLNGAQPTNANLTAVGAVVGISTTWTNIIAGVITQRLTTVSGILRTNLML